ncbi:MAG TPA: hypothetical protein VEK14_07465, partial [Rhodomicrobium sp.]|nr:hypothetical protein [Rhodomicrobium sp.]
LGLCQSPSSTDDNGWQAVLLKRDMNLAVSVAVIHSATMIVAGGGIAWLVYHYLGLKVLSRGWINLDPAWAASLIFVGASSLAVNLLRAH